MAGSTDGPTPPDGLPDAVVTELEALSPDELRKAIIHAQELLQSREERASPVEPEPGDDIIRMTEREGYIEVVKQFSCTEGCRACPHGPYLYHVTEVPQPDGGKETRWSFIGRVKPDEE